MSEAASGWSPRRTSSATTSGVDEKQLVEQFIPMYRIAIQLENVDFLFDRLHPEVLTLSTPELCRDFIEREILALQVTQAHGAGMKTK